MGGGQRVMEGLSAFWSGVGLRCMENNKRPISNASAVDGSIAGRAAPPKPPLPAPGSRAVLRSGTSNLGTLHRLVSRIVNKQSLRLHENCG